MLVDIISDIHQDFWMKNQNPQHPKFKKELDVLINIILPEDKSKIGDVLIIAGDTGHYNQQIMFLLIELKKYYKDIIITWGNHCMYLVNKSQVSKYRAQSENRLIELKEICESLDIHFLDGQVIEILKNKEIDLKSLMKDKEYYKSKIGNKKFKAQKELYEFISRV